MEYIKASEDLHPGVMVPAEGWSVVISRSNGSWDLYTYHGNWGENCYPLFLNNTLTKRSARRAARRFLKQKEEQEKPVPDPDTEVITTHIRTTTDMGPH